MNEKELDLHNVSKENIQIIGAELKRRRITQSKTLVTLNTKCSVSYISKIENGKIIPKFHILNELCQEQGITTLELEKLLKVDEIINESIHALFWLNKDKIVDLYNQVYQFDNYKVNLVKIIYEMQYFHWNMVEIYLNSLTIIKDNLEEKDLHLYYYLSMCYENAMCNYPRVYELYRELKYCKNNYLLALVSKEMFIAVAKFGMESPLLAYEEYTKHYKGLFNYSIEGMYELLIDTLIDSRYELQAPIIDELKNTKKLRYLLIQGESDGLEELLEKYTPSQYEKLLIATYKKDYALGEKIYKKLQLNRLCAKDLIIANYCNYINKGNDEELANFIVQVGIDYAQKTNDGNLFRILLKKLSEIAFYVGKYKAVATMNLAYFEMADKCRNCLL